MSVTPETNPGATPPAGNAGAETTVTYTKAEIDQLIAGIRSTPATPPASTTPAKPPVGDKVSVQEIAALRQLRAKLDEIAEGKNPEEVLTEYRDLREQSLTAQERQREADERAKKADETIRTLEQRYNNTLIERDVLDAALPKVVSASAAKLILKELKDSAKVSKDGKVTYELEVSINGVNVKKALNATDAVTLLESKVAEYGTLFKSSASSGSGAQANDNRYKTADGQLSLEALQSMTMEDYFKTRAENPSALGFNRPMAANG